MLAFDQDTWTTVQEIPTKENRSFNAGELNCDEFSRAATPDPNEDDLDDDDDLDLDEDDDLDLEDDDLNDDVVPGYEEDLDAEDLDEDEEDEDYDRINGVATSDLRSGVTASYDDTDEPDETPEQGEADNEDLGYPSEQEVSQPQEGSDTSYSEQTDVTPPTPQEFPSVGSPETNFSSRDHGRTTGRMVGHEPGTEGI